MTTDLPIAPGDTTETAQLSPCVGGLVRTWVDSGESRLWATPDAEWLMGAQGIGAIARTVQEEGRFREVGMLAAGTGTMIVPSRRPAETEGGSVTVESKVVRLAPAPHTGDAVWADLRALLARAVSHCIAEGEYLVVEKGGWDAPIEPFCLFILLAEKETTISVIETAPAPRRSAVWAPHIVPDRPTHTLSAPADAGTIDVVPTLMLEAIATWGLHPWDIALTFGRRP